MDIHARLGQIMSEDFAVLPGTSSPGEARRLLGGRRFGIVTGEDGEPVSLITGEDLEGANINETAILQNPAIALPPLVSGPPDIGLAAVAETPQITWLAAGARGIVVTLGGTSLGVVPVGELETYLGLGPDVQPVETLGRAGRGIGPLIATVRCRYDMGGGTMCGMNNPVQVYDPRHRPICLRQPPRHTLKM